jgi:hypothetical protein
MQSPCGFATKCKNGERLRNKPSTTKEEKSFEERSPRAWKTEKGFQGLG